MKKYIKPEIMAANIKAAFILAGSIQIIDEPADPDYPMGGDARRHYVDVFMEGADNN